MRSRAESSERPGQLLDAADPVAQRVTVTEERLRRPLPLPVALDEGLERAHQLAAVGALGVLDRREDRVAEQPQRVVVLQREQQLEGAEVAVGGQRAAPVAVAVDGQRARLQRAARLVEAAPQLGRRDAAAGARRERAGRPRAPRARACARRARTARRRRPRAAARTGSARRARRARRRPPRARARASASSAAARAPRGGCDARARPPRSRSPNGSSRRASSAPARSPATSAVSTSPASRRSVSSTTRRRSSSSATIVTAWCSVSRSSSFSGPASLAAISHASGSGPSPRGDSPRARPAAPARRAGKPSAPGRSRAARPARVRSRSSVAERLARRRRSPARPPRAREHLAARVEDQRRPADHRRQRAGHAVQAALGEHDPLQPLVRGQRAPQHRVLLVDEVRERLLGDRDERQLVGHLEQREAVLGGRLRAAPPGTCSCEKPAPKPSPVSPCADEPRDVLALLRVVAELQARREQQLAARQPRRRVRQLGDVDPAHGAVEPGLAGDDVGLQLAQQIAQRQHRAVRALRCSSSATLMRRCVRLYRLRPAPHGGARSPAADQDQRGDGGDEREQGADEQDRVEAVDEARAAPAGRARVGRRGGRRSRPAPRRRWRSPPGGTSS